MRLVLSLVSAASALVAAGFWMRASRKPATPNPTVDGSLGRDFEESLYSSAKANAYAARFAAVAALLQGLASVLG